MRQTRYLLLSSFLFAATACQPADSPDAAEDTGATAEQAADPATRLARATMEAMGGQEAWDRGRFVTFRWLVEREGEVVADRMHAWDRYDGRYRVEFDRDGAHHVVNFNVNEVRKDAEGRKIPSGQAWVDGVALTGEELQDALAMGYRAFINDSYWILMPYKWEDPGVHLTMEPDTTLSDGQTYHVVRLDYDEDLGVTEDRFWGFVDPNTGRMAAWRYHLQDQPEPGALIWWEDWQERGGVMMSMDRRWEDGADRRIYFDDVTVSEAVPEGYFDPPSS